MNTRIECPHCGSQVASDVPACRHCGKRINIERAYESQLRQRTNRMMLGFGAVIAVLVAIASARALI